MKKIIIAGLVCLSIAQARITLANDNEHITKMMSQNPSCTLRLVEAFLNLPFSNMVAPPFTASTGKVLSDMGVVTIRGLLRLSPQQLARKKNAVETIAEIRSFLDGFSIRWPGDNSKEKSQTLGYLAQVPIEQLDLPETLTAKIKAMKIATLKQLHSFSGPTLVSEGNLSLIEVGIVKVQLFRFGVLWEGMGTGGPTDTLIENLNLSDRATKCLASVGIFTLEQLLQETPGNLLQIHGFAASTLEEVEDRLKGLSVTWNVMNLPIRECFSVRTRTLLINAKFRTIGQLYKKTAVQLLNDDQIGEIAVKEVRDVLTHLGLIWDGQ